MRSIYFSVLVVALASAISNVNASPVSASDASAIPTSSVDTKVYRQYQRREAERTEYYDTTGAVQDEDKGGKYKDEYHGYLRREYTEIVPGVTATPDNDVKYKDEYHGYLRREAERTELYDTTAAAQDEDKGGKYKDEYHGYLRREAERTEFYDTTAAPQEDNNGGGYKKEYHGYLRRQESDTVPGEVHPTTVVNNNAYKVKYPGNQRLI
ncbi:hypothetical protein LPJ53_004584 [Coemansia erecta]|uniref:Uncharacterized protein n=1 Tax=Coemansia erecta TaxID=147472 RepID=A0A9W8CP10_9FUNG|nr:hypothetical protein LPJ53_004584 [Coemansia erecta]